MKVAILLAGQPRFFRINNSILDLKQKYNADVFIHTWSIKDEDFYVSPYAPTVWEKKINDVDDYIKMYKPKDFLIEDALTDEFINSEQIIEIGNSKISTLKKRNIEKDPRIVSEWVKNFFEVGKNNLYRWFYSIKMCANLAKNHNYDVYIITRPDVLIHKFPNIDLEHIMTPLIHNHTSTLDSYYFEASLISIPHIYLDAYTDIINKFDEYYDDKGYPYAHDHMPFAHLYETGLINNVRQHNTQNFWWQLIRSEDGNTRHTLY
jgi:hypothetical protein